MDHDMLVGIDMMKEQLNMSEHDPQPQGNINATLVSADNALVVASASNACSPPQQSGSGLTDTSLPVVNSTSIISAPPQQTGPASINSLPVELATLIFEILKDDDRTAAIALGLTCPGFYAILKTLFPDPIAVELGPLKSYICPRYEITPLRHYILSFLCPKYRHNFLSAPEVYTPFLLRSIYSNKFSKKEKELY